MWRAGWPAPTPPVCLPLRRPQGADKLATVTVRGLKPAPQEDRPGIVSSETAEAPAAMTAVAGPLLSGRPSRTAAVYVRRDRCAQGIGPLPRGAPTARRNPEPAVSMPSDGGRGLGSCSLGEGLSRGEDQARSPRPRRSASVRACGEARFQTFRNAISCSRKEENFPSMVGTLRENPNIAELASSLNCLPTMRCYIFLSSFFWQGENWEKHVLTKSTLENTIERQLISQQNL